MTIKRRGEEEGYPDPKRARVVACEDGYETSGLLGRMTIKRRGEEEEGYPDPKRARVVACDDGHETSGSLGTTVWRECQEEDEDVLVLDVDRELLEEMEALLIDLKL